MKEKPYIVTVQQVVEYRVPVFVPDDTDIESEAIDALATLDASDIYFDGVIEERVVLIEPGADPLEEH